MIGPHGGGFARFYAEIFRNEGLTSVEIIEVSSLDHAALADRAVVLVADTPVQADGVEVLESYVHRGGCLVAMRPGAELAGLLGLVPTSACIDDGYLLVDTTSPPGAGITSSAMQFHGRADCWTLGDARQVAQLLNAERAPLGPAVTLRMIGERGGCAVAFTYDLARSVVLTRQGNPAWAGQNRDGDVLIRSDDLFFGAAVDDPRPDWVDSALLGVPQADEQQRLLVALITAATSTQLPLPRFWYLPHGNRAAVVMTGDDHGTGGTVRRFERYESLSPPGGVVEDWECVRATSYVFPRTPIPWRKQIDFNRKGFEVALHVNTHAEDWTPSQLRSLYTDQLSWFRNRLPFAGSPVTHRTHCVTWSDYVSQVHVEAENGIRLDTNYYFYPPRWVAGRAGYFTGSALPMRFADLDGAVLDVYQVATQISDESAQELPGCFEALVEAAMGDDGFVTVVTVNAHTDYDESGVSDAVVHAALARGVPVISARQLLTWLDGRNGSRVDAVQWDGEDLHFNVWVDPRARGLQLLVPTRGPQGKSLAEVRLDGAPVPSPVESYKGVQYARVAASTGGYRVRYASRPSATTVAAPEASAVSGTSHALVARHDGCAAFSVGELDGLVVSSASGGEVVLAPRMHASFDGDALPAGWAASAGVVVLHGRAVLRGGCLSTVRGVEPTAVEAALTFTPGAVQRFGMGIESGDRATFEVQPDGRMEVVTWQGGRRLSTGVPGAWTGGPHRFRIDREAAGTVRYWIDGSDVAVVAAELPDHVPVIAEDENPDGAGLTIEWVRVLPHQERGTYTSPIVDSGVEATWGSLSWTAVFAQGTTLEAEVRCGREPVIDGSWTPWVPVLHSGADLTSPDRYLQYRFTMGRVSGFKSPALRAVELSRRA